nr:hypothetical protein [Tanacetum cinerariifolium]
MSTQQDIYNVGSENRPPMLNKENYVPWSRMIPEPGDPNREVHVNETFHVQTDDELTEKELKQIEADDQPFRPSFSVFPKTSILPLIAVKVLRKSGYEFNK